MYDHVGAARDAGVNLAFLSGNSVWGVVPLLPSVQGQAHRVMRREDKFLGPELSKMLDERRGVAAKYPAGPDGALLMGGAPPALAEALDLRTNADHWLHKGTGMKNGDTVEGLVGWEWHGLLHAVCRVWKW